MQHHSRLAICVLPICLMVSFLPAAVAHSEHQIPRQVIFTGKPARLHDMPKEIQWNVQKTVGWHPSNDSHATSPHLLPRWFGDAACHRYIQKHYDEELLRFFDQASPGYYRGDICRAAVLYREGGFYVDVDVQMAVPLDDLVDANTTFASVHSIKGDIFNGLLAVVPQSEIMKETLSEIRKWYRNETSHDNLMGTKTLQRALANVMEASCPSKNMTELMGQTLQWTCGKHVVRLYREGDLLCFVKKGVPQPFECPIERKKGDLLMRYGFFIPGQKVNFKRTIIAWPRLLDCKDAQAGCGSGGHVSFLQQSEVQIDSTGTVNRRSSFIRYHPA